MYPEGVESVYDIVWNEGTTYGDVHKENEYQFSKYNFEVADTGMLFNHFDDARAECHRALEAGLPLPAYDQCMMASHLFNTLDARKAISVTQRQDFILQIRELAKGCATLYKEQESSRLERIKQ